MKDLVGLSTIKRKDNQYQKDLQSIGETPIDLIELNKLLENRFSLNLNRVSYKGWRLAGFLTNKPVYSICWIGLGVVGDIFNSPISTINKLLEYNKQ